MAQHTEEYLFVYGTLMPGFAPSSAVQALMDRLQPIGAASVPGRLFDFGPFPGAVPLERQAEVVQSGLSNSRVRGILFRLPDDGVDEVLRQLDRYEGYEAKNLRGAPEVNNSLFVRRVVLSELEGSEESVQAWVYWFNGSTAGVQEIPNGDFARWKQGGR